MRKPKKIDVKRLREKLGLNQSDFWNAVDVTQSGGSRYESGRPMPRPVRRLVGWVYLGEPIQRHVG